MMIKNFKLALIVLLSASAFVIIVLSSCHNNRTSGNLIGRWMNDSVNGTVQCADVESFSEDGTWVSISRTKGKHFEMEIRSSGNYERRGDSLYISCFSSTVNGKNIGGSHVVRQLLEVSDTILEYKVKDNVSRLKRVIEK